MESGSGYQVATTTRAPVPVSFRTLSSAGETRSTRALVGLIRCEMAKGNRRARGGASASRQAMKAQVRKRGIQLSNVRGLVTGTLSSANGHWILTTSDGVQVVEVNYSSPGRLADVEREWLVESCGRGRAAVASPPGWKQSDPSDETSGQSVIARSAGLPSLGKHHR